MSIRIGATTYDEGKLPLIMGILNVTPDSFSDGGQFTNATSIADHVGQMIASGADIIDVGGESTRPFSTPVSLDEELDRVLPAITTIRRQSAIPISIDTSKAEVARQALLAGADLVNDVSAGLFDNKMSSVVREFQVPYIIMHMQGTPKDMQKAPKYDDIIKETLLFFERRIDELSQLGVPKASLIIDPGIGFGKTVAHNLSIIKHLHRYHAIGCPLLIGHSRKSFIGKVLENEGADREIATAFLSGYMALKQAAIIRVHDVAANAQAIRMAQALAKAP